MALQVCHMTSLCKGQLKPTHFNCPQAVVSLVSIVLFELQQTFQDWKEPAASRDNNENGILVSRHDVPALPMMPCK